VCVIGSAEYAELDEEEGQQDIRNGRVLGADDEEGGKREKENDEQ